jgi:epsilon-lactone hydrolase
MLSIGTKTTFRHGFGRKLVASWTRDFEIGNLFWRHQFNRAFAFSDINEGRAYFDSLQTWIDEAHPVKIEPVALECDRLKWKPMASTESVSHTLKQEPGAGTDAGSNATRTKPAQNGPAGAWLVPEHRTTEANVLYFHGGGYAFHAAVTKQFARMLAGMLGARTFALNYRLTPERPHPAQLDDAVAAYRCLLEQGIDPARLVVAGDSAGGHLALMLLLALRDKGLPQPALVIGMCPWTDIGEHGGSLTANNRFDLVQGYMAIQFGKWLQGNTTYSREELSPIFHDFSGLAPIYLQGGGREILIDMIRNFAVSQAANGTEIMLDVWPDMTHEFQAYGSTLPESKEAFQRMRDAIDCYTVGTKERKLAPCHATAVDGISSSKNASRSP